MSCATLRRSCAGNAKLRQRAAPARAPSGVLDRAATRAMMLRSAAVLGRM